MACRADQRQSRLPWPQRLQPPAASAAPWQVAWGRARSLSDPGENFAEVCARKRRAPWPWAYPASMARRALFVAFLELLAVPAHKAEGTRVPSLNTQESTRASEA